MIDIKRLDSSSADFAAQFETLLSSYSEPDEKIVHEVTSIIKDVKSGGDQALLEYTNRFDHRQADIEDLIVSRERISEAMSGIPEKIRQALSEASDRIRRYHERQKAESWSFSDKDGTYLGQQVTALDRVGVYVPGGKAAYPSTVLMNVIPAQVAGVKEISMVVPAPGDELNEIVLAAAGIVGVNHVYSIGGAQAIAALTYGTETIPKVDKIVGPGNQYVATAKRLVFGMVGIDMIAGPSEILVVSDTTVDPDWIAMDMFAQAEHDEDARAIFVCVDGEFINKVVKSIQRLLPEMDRVDIIEASLQKNGVMIKVKDLDEAAEIVNQIAPEHLELSVAEPQELLPRIRHAGAIFMGKYSAEVLGDYCAGPNHVLPTAGTARFSSPLGVYDFQKRSSLINCNASSVLPLAVTASTLARSEGLTAHARSAELRMDVDREK